VWRRNLKTSRLISGIARAPSTICIVYTVNKALVRRPRTVQVSHRKRHTRPRVVLIAVNYHSIADAYRCPSRARGGQRVSDWNPAAPALLYARRGWARTPARASDAAVLLSGLR
jgi:hypothetical protein